MKKPTSWHKCLSNNMGHNMQILGVPVYVDLDVDLVHMVNPEILGYRKLIIDMIT